MEDVSGLLGNRGTCHFYYWEYGGIRKLLNELGITVETGEEIDISFLEGFIQHFWE